MGTGDDKFERTSSHPYVGHGGPFVTLERKDSTGLKGDPFPVNPFAAVNAQALTVTNGAARATHTYALVKSHPELNAQEVELADVPAVEVMILWGDSVLQVSHLSPPRNYWVGEDQACDFSLSEEIIGARRLPLVVVEGAETSVIIPRGARGSIELPGQRPLSLDEARYRGQPYLQLLGAYQLPVQHGTRVCLEIGNITCRINWVNAGKPVAHGLASGVDWNALAYYSLSALSIGGLVGAMAFFSPSLGLQNDEDIDQDRFYLIRQYLSANAERELAEQASSGVEKSALEREPGAAASGEAGSLGSKATQTTRQRHAVRGPENNPDPHLSREAALREATEFGIVGLLNAGIAGEPNAPSAYWGREAALGIDALSAMGTMFGKEIGEAAGTSGLGLSGIGESGDDRGTYIALDSIGTIHHGTGGVGKFGPSTGLMAGEHHPKEPQLRPGHTTVEGGRVPAEVIQRIVRQNYGRFRLCYEQGLHRNPNLEGRATVRFVIGRDGAVSNVTNGGSDLPDPAVLQCTLQAFYGLSFPPAADGIVSVVYPIVFTPS